MAGRHEAGVAIRRTRLSGGEPTVAVVRDRDRNRMTDFPDTTDPGGSVALGFSPQNGFAGAGAPMPAGPRTD